MNENLKKWLPWIAVAAVAVVVVAVVALSSGGEDETASATTTAAGETTTTTATATTTTSAETTTSGGPTTTTGEAVELKIAAESNEAFTLDRLKAPAGVEVSVVFQNKDVGGDPHNWHIVVDAGVEEYGSIVADAPDTQTITFTIGKPGDYDFYCDTHAEAMKGIFTATP